MPSLIDTISKSEIPRPILSNICALILTRLNHVSTLFTNFFLISAFIAFNSLVDSSVALKCFGRIEKESLIVLRINILFTAIISKKI